MEVTTVEALLTDTLVSRQLYLWPPSQKQRFELPYKLCIYSFLLSAAGSFRGYDLKEITLFSSESYFNHSTSHRCSSQ